MSSIGRQRRIFDVAALVYLDRFVPFDLCRIRSAQVSGSRNQSTEAMNFKNHSAIQERYCGVLRVVVVSLGFAELNGASAYDTAPIME